MKLLNRILIITTGMVLAMSIMFACDDKNDGELIWTDPPSSADTLYQNPLFEPDVADPTVIRGNDGFFYAYGTENLWYAGVTRLIPIVRSKNLTKWEYVADVFTTKPNWKNEGGLWAPCMVYKDGTYYLYYSFSKWGDSNPGVGLATSQYPYGPFTDLGKIFDSSSTGVGNSIDPFYIETGEGRGKKKYIFWGSYRGIYGSELADDMKTLKGEKFKIAGDAFEATYIHVKYGKFYFFGSNDNCCDGKDTKYRVSVAVADNIKGPYYTKDGKSILPNGQEGTPFLYGNMANGWVGPGHNSEIITDDKGRDFILYHAVQYTNPLLPGGATRRPLMMDEVTWVDEWPVIANNTPSSTLQPAPYFE